MLLKRESNDTTGAESIHNLSCKPTGFLFVGLSFARVSQNWERARLAHRLKPFRASLGVSLGINA